VHYTFEYCDGENAEFIVRMPSSLDTSALKSNTEGPKPEAITEQMAMAGVQNATAGWAKGNET